jgi:hypothetical protein
MLKEGMKTCTKCGVPQDEGNYFKHSSTKDGLRPWCKSCCAKHLRAYRAKEASFSIGSLKEDVDRPAIDKKLSQNWFDDL